ncbi:Gamma-glutamyl phosphate reductase [Frankliniella fusca]|uniref:Gamma-glutamyl phosphate reductase n=1 Tax=Frankliniella fusca TaxID=407009 RepID=A0AAE1H3C8_9NEOP|nr:Gamma-glutamyl phosphate reductase [Frankliniella fusca]
MSLSSAAAPPVSSVLENMEAEETQARDNWYIALGVVGGVVVVLTVLSILYRKGLLCGRSRMRRPSHAQPWLHWDWGTPRSRLPSLFDLLHVPGPGAKSRKPSGALTLESGLPAPAPAPGQASGHTLQVPAEVLGQRLEAVAEAGAVEQTSYIVSEGRHATFAPTLLAPTEPPEPSGPAGSPPEPELHLGAGAAPK